jgi:hypothetical protein
VPVKEIWSSHGDLLATTLGISFSTIAIDYIISQSIAGALNKNTLTLWNEARILISKKLLKGIVSLVK